MNREIELKFEVEPDFADRIAVDPPFDSEDRHSDRQRSVYYDTADGQLRKNGYVLRVRSTADGYVQTVKSLGGGAGLFGRAEWECALGGAEPDRAKLDGTPIADLKLGQLQPVLESNVNRTAFQLHDRDSSLKIDIDQGLILASGRKSPVSEIEIELIQGKPEAAVTLARRIAETAPAKLSVMSKAERGFALADDSLSICSKAERVEIRPEMSVAEAFETIVTACIRHFRLNEPLVIEHRSIEGLHQARVAIRRLRAAFTLFRPVISDAAFDRIETDIGWFTRELGEARNFDVYLQRDLPDDERRIMQSNREEAYDAVIAAMNSQRLQRVMLDLVAWAKLGQWRSSKPASRPIRPFARRRIDRLWKSVSQKDRLARLSAKKRHHLRIRAKKLRYSLEFMRALHQRRQRRKRFGRAIERLQDELGQANDVAIARKLTTSPDMWTDRRHKREVREHVRAGQRALRRLRKVGRYWKG